jgi:hypothetical protein
MTFRSTKAFEPVALLAAAIAVTAASHSKSQKAVRWSNSRVRPA